MQRIIPNIWFDHTAAEAADFYANAFPDGRVLSTVRYPTEGLPDFQADFAGDVLTVEFELGGFRFVGINAGAEFRPNPALSFFVNVDAASPDAVDHIDALWDALGDGGTALMPLQAYPFSERFGWMQDRYGVSWQLMLVESGGAPRPFITPSLMFTAGVQGRARERCSTTRTSSAAASATCSSTPTAARWPAR